MTKASLKSVVDGQNASIQEASSPEPIIKIDTECYRQHVLTRIQTTIVMIQPQHPLRISHVLAVKRSVKVGEKLRGQALIGIEEARSGSANLNIHLSLMGLDLQSSCQRENKGTEPSHTARMPIYIGTTFERSKNGQRIFARSY